MSLSEKPLSYYEKNKAHFLEDLKKLVRIPSVSFEGFPKENVVKSAQAVAELFKESGLENIELLNFPGTHPYVYADWLHAPGKPTLLLYAHHDVQPPGRDALWKTKPFDPVEVNGRLFGRGTADDKAGVVVHTAAIASYLKTHGKLPLNIKLIIEGEEECGSPTLFKFLEKYKNKLKADAMILTDTQNYDTGLPSLTIWLRGLVAFEIEVKSLERSVHSGMLGGPAPDPTLALCRILNSMTDTEGRITIPGLQEMVKPLSDKEKKAISDLPFNLTEFRSQSGFLPNTRFLASSDGTVNPLVQMWREPAFSINAFEAGKRSAAANIICDSAWAKFGVRTVAGMNPEKTARLIEEHVRRVAPWGVEVKLTPESCSNSWSTEPKGKAFDSALVALEKGYGKKAVFMGAGGTIPFVEPFSDALGGAPALLIGVEDPYTNAHSENESMDISDFEKAIKSAIYFYEEFAK